MESNQDITSAFCGVFNKYFPKELFQMNGCYWQQEAASRQKTAAYGRRRFDDCKLIILMNFRLQMYIFITRKTGNKQQPTYKGIKFHGLSM